MMFGSNAVVRACQSPVWRWVRLAVAVSLAAVGWEVAGEAGTVSATVYARGLNDGTIDPRVFGNFVELLDDVVPGMWAEMLNDRSFEGIVSEANWSYYDGSLDICDRAWDSNGTWSRVEEEAFNGARCARLSPGGAAASLTQSGLSARRGMEYEFSGHLRTDPGVKAKARLKFLLPSGGWLILASADLPAVSTNWQKVSVKMRSNGETDRAVFELEAEGSGNLWADKLSLMPADNVQGWRRDVVEVIKASKPSVIRWGGSTVDPGHYEWKKGIGDRDRRVPWLNRNWGRLDPNDVGIGEFCEFCEAVEAEPLICVSFADGAQSAGELVEYCNGGAGTPWGAKRVADGRAELYGVKYIQIGNEISGRNADYLRQIPDFIAAIKKADPSVKIMTSFPSQQLLEEVGKDIAFVCPHYYTADFKECENELSKVCDLIDRTPGCGGVKIGVTEWNIDAGSWGLGRAAQATLGSALENARLLQIFLRHGDKVKIACRSNLANSYCGATIETSPTGYGVLKRASYYVMELYQRHTLPRPLAVEESSNALDLFVCGSQDGKSIVVYAVNQSGDSVDLSLGFNGFVGTPKLVRAEAVCDTQDTGQPDIINHWNAPDRIKINPVSVSGDGVTLPRLSVTAIEGQRD